MSTDNSTQENKYGVTYPRAQGRMLEVFAKCECPVCGDEMDAFDSEHEDSDTGHKLHLDTYKCDYCRLFVTYVTLAKYHVYHDVPDNEKWYTLESISF